MAPRPQGPKGAGRRRGWSYSAGEKGKTRVRVYERPGYGLWIDFRDEAGKRCRHPLGMTDREAAKAKADEIAASFRTAAKRRPAERTLATLLESYQREVTPGKGVIAQRNDARTFALFLTCFGASRRPETLSRRDLDRYCAERRSGRLRPPKARAGGVRGRVLEKDVALLNAVLNWGAQAGDGEGGFLLARNPLKGLAAPKEESPRRALLTAEQYARVRTAAAAIGPDVEALVVLAWHTGHRSASIRQLRWSDVDLEAGRIRWRAEHDKIGLEHVNPLHPDAVAILRRERARAAAIGDALIFPARRGAAGRPLSADGVRSLWRRIAAKAELPAGERYGWHSLRRAFANRLRHAPLRDLQDLGGWKTAATLLTVYLRADEDAQRAVLEGVTPALPTIDREAQAQ